MTRKLTPLYRQLSAVERTKLILAAALDGEEADPQIWDTVPQGQEGEFKQLQDLHTAVTVRLVPWVLTLQSQVQVIEAEWQLLTTIAAWAEERIPLLEFALTCVRDEIGARRSSTLEWLLVHASTGPQHSNLQLLVSDREDTGSRFTTADRDARAVLEEFPAAIRAAWRQLLAYEAAIPVLIARFEDQDLVDRLIGGVIVGCRVDLQSIQERAEQVLGYIGSGEMNVSARELVGGIVGELKRSA